METTGAECSRQLLFRGKLIKAQIRASADPYPSNYSKRNQEGDKLGHPVCEQTVEDVHQADPDAAEGPKYSAQPLLADGPSVHAVPGTVRLAHQPSGKKD
jgi:hypothetical protein